MPCGWNTHLDFVFVLFQFPKFRQLLKEAILLNDRLREYTEKCIHLYADDSENLTPLDSAQLHRSDDADTTTDCVASVQSEFSGNDVSEHIEKRTVRIMPASQNQLCHSVSSPAALQSNVDCSSVIDKQESVKIVVRFRFLRFILRTEK